MLRFLLTFFFFVRAFGLFAQCSTANVELTTQTAVDAFPSNCVTMTTVLTIDDDGTDPITDLSPLANLEVVPTLRIFNTTLSDFSGLSNVKTISGTLIMTYNSGITSLGAFSSLDPVGTELNLASNSSLTNCDEFCDFIGVTPTISIGSNSVGACQSSTAFEQACAALPIELSYFEAKKIAHTVVLEWETKSELNNNGFEIEKSLDGKHWTEIGWVDGQGTDDRTNQYEFVDFTPAKKVNYYRMKQIDFDGRFEYSPVVNAYFSISSTAYAYPNPTKDEIHIGGVSGEVLPVIRIFNNLGQNVMTTQGTRLNVGHLPQGTYTLELQLNDEVRLERIIIE